MQKPVTRFWQSHFELRTEFFYAGYEKTRPLRSSFPLLLCRKYYLSFLQKFEYEKLVKILLFIVSEHNSDEGLFVQRAGICLLNSLAVQVDGPQKLLVGNLGAMEKMLEVIRTKLQLGNIKQQCIDF